MRTRDVVAATFALAERFPRVMVRAKTSLWHPIRFAQHKLAPLAPRICRNPAAFDGERDAWNAEGGVLLYTRGFREKERIEAHDAAVIAECPFTLRALEDLAQCTREEAAVFVPPNWDEHERTVYALNPPASMCERFYRMIETAPARPDIEAVLGLQPGSRVLADDEVMPTLGVDRETTMTAMRRHLLPWRKMLYVVTVYPRVAPTERLLAEAYEHIVAAPKLPDGSRCLTIRYLMRATKRWNYSLRMLERRGSIKVLPPLHFYRLDREPSWMRIDSQHERAKRDLRAVAAFVTELPEYPAKESHLPQRAPRSRSRSTACA